MHQRIHKGVRPFQCTPCGVFFRQKAHLQKHQKTQGHIQASEIYEKKRREGGGGVETATAGAENNNGRNSKPTRQTLLKEEDEEEESLHSSEDSSLHSDPPVVDSSTAAAATPPAITARPDSSDDTSPSSTSTGGGGSGGRSRFKSSPKRKQSRPTHVRSCERESGGGGEEEELEEKEDKIRSFVDYNDTTHGYECRQCAFASHDLSVLKDHVREEHLSTKSELMFKCPECQITFSKEFNLRIHNRKHETSSQFLPCDHCEQVFKVPNKLIKHMEGVHSVCPNCGDRMEDKAALARHQEEAHDVENAKNVSSRAGFHSSLLQFTPLASLKSPTSSSSSSSSMMTMENRAAKMRKVDSLAETIRQKQLLNHATSAVNGNESKHLHHHHSSPLSSPKNRRKNDMTAVRALLAAAKATTPLAMAAAAGELPPMAMAPMNNQSVHDLLRKSAENNNILSRLKLLPPDIRLPTKPIAGLTPPSSPPPPQQQQRHMHHHHQMPPPMPQQQPSQIRGEVSVTIVPAAGRPLSRSDGEDEEENGLDLSIRSRSNGGGGGDDDDENEVSTTVPPLPPPISAAAAAAFASSRPDLYGRYHHHPTFPFPPFFLPPGAESSAALTEHLMKLGLPRPPLPPPQMPSPKQTATSSLSQHPYTVLSAMLGQPPPPPPPPQLNSLPVFPGMPSVFRPPSPGPASGKSIKDVPALGKKSARDCNFPNHVIINRV